MEIYTLPSGHDVFLDDDDFLKLSGYKYYLHKKGYAYRFEVCKCCKHKKAIYLHHDVVGNHEGMVVDHINRNKLDNQKSNLRVVSNKNNLHNSEKYRKNATSKYKGVCWIKTAKAWQATMRINGKQTKLGLFETEEAAANAYNEKAKEHQGEFAYLNDVPYDPDWNSKLIPNRRDGIGTSKYKGVSYRPKYDDWQCHIMVNYKSIFLGTFKDEIEAAEAYNEAAIKYRGDKAKLNKFD